MATASGAQVPLGQLADVRHAPGPQSIKSEDTSWPCLMTTATTTLALLPVITSTGRGADVTVPMAVPSIGGMLVATITIFVVPTLVSLRARWELRRGATRAGS